MHHFLILGGDLRQRYLYQILKQSEPNVTGYFEKSPSFCLRQAMEVSDIILCPIPFTKDGQTLFFAAPQTGIEIPFFLKHLKKGHILFGGVLPAEVIKHCEVHSIPCFDFMQMEDVACKNAVATAEGAIAEAITLSQKNLYQSSSLILGFGRCAQVLADRLKGLGAHVTVAARDKKKLAPACSLSFDTLPLKELEPESHRFDYIFNTIPAMVLDTGIIRHLKPETVIIDIASSPGGTDFEACSRQNIRAKLCPGLPGLYAPLSSAEILWEAVTGRL